MSGWTILGILFLIACVCSIVTLWIGGAFADSRDRAVRQALAERDAAEQKARAEWARNKYGADS